MTKEEINLAKPLAHFAKQQYRQPEQFSASCDDAVTVYSRQAVELVPANWAALRKRRYHWGR